MAAPLSAQSSGLGGWFGALKRKRSSGHSHDTRSKLDQWQQHEDSVQQSLWSPEVASAMGYGKNGRAGSAFQWWILVLSALLAIGSFIAWCVLIFRARDSTQAAIDALQLNIRWWDALAAILLATAVCYPVFTLLAIGVSLWRGRLARRLNIHAPDAAWLRSCRAFQAANVTSSVLLYGLTLLMIISIAAHCVWAYNARAAHLGSYYAIRYVDPVWSGVGAVINQTTGLVDSFVGLASSATGANGRRLVQHDPAGGMSLADLTEADLAVLPGEVLAAGLAAGRSLQQAAGMMDVVQGVVNGAANVLGGAAAAVGAGPNLASLLPGGSSNPLLGTLQSVTRAVQGQLLNRDGCPMYCVDLRDQKWIRNGCICDLARVKAAYPHLARVFRDVAPAIAAVFLMTIAATWLLLHAAAQWARTRSEAKLLSRLPSSAAALAAAGRPGGSGAGSGRSVDVMAGSGGGKQQQQQPILDGIQLASV